MRHRRYPVTMYDYTPSDISRLWSNINVLEDVDACWEWQSGLNTGGYGHLSIRGKARLAHRLVYAVSYGDFSHNLCVCHTCDNRLCCNPHHLFLGTVKDNNQDRTQKGRGGGHKIKGEGNGNHKLTSSDVEEIRKLYATGLYSQQTIGKQFGVHQTVVSSIILNRTWRS